MVPVKLLKILVSCMLLVLVILFLDIPKFVGVILSVNLFVFPLLFALVFVNIFLYILSYWILLDRRVSLIKNIFDYLVVWSFGLFLPGKIGELAIIPILKKKYAVSYKDAVFAVVLPKGVILAIFLLIFALFIYAAQVLIFVFISILLVVFLLAFLRGKIRNFVSVFVPQKYLEVFNFKKLFSFNFILVIFLGVLRFLSLIVFTHLTLLSFGASPSIAWVSFAIAISQITTFLPISLNGLGLREVTFIGIMQLHGVSAEVATGAIILSFVANYGLALISILAWNLTKD